MNVLILGGHGMAGHMIVRYLTKMTDYNVSYTHRNPEASEGIYLDVRKTHDLKMVLEQVKPEVVINCVGILNERAAGNVTDAIKVNSLLPHVLKDELDRIDARLIHISTDCVYSGSKGKYEEADQPDGTSMYARTKVLGEVVTSPHLTIRTSIIGPELKDGIGLYHWFMKQTGDLKGFVDVYWNGVTTLELAKAIVHLMNERVSGLIHLTAPDIVSKYTLLTKFQEVFGKNDVRIHPYHTEKCDRTLRNTRSDVTYEVASYDQMLMDLKEWMNA